MALFRNNEATLSYAGLVILEKGDMLSASDDIFSIDLQFTTQTVDLLDAARPALGNFGNTQEKKSFTIVRDYPTPAAAMTAAQEIADFAETHPLGDLTYTCGEYSKTWAAGVSSLRVNTSVPPIGVRVTYVWEFMLKNKN